ncbi:hypothetical protein CH273_03565 [Rhodococcus sp. 05-339-2]|uniref:PucR family transcriptional regulator n=1 Tax=Rhodococcoides fascians TaxID=1828 RepID=UPI00050CB05A|nr:MULTISPECIES: helix-turn-helix domain-containing protein [Rhodococcus]OZD85813.1 hypothetical protein CH273_03565 [Rhodococcus sp. 05-339-2]
MRSYHRSIDELVDEAVGLIWNTYRGYTNDVLSRSELDYFVRRNIEVVLDCVGRGVTPSGEELGHARELGISRAQEGVPLESVIQAFRSTERVLLLHVLRSQDSATGTTPTELALSCFDALTNSMIDAYREASSVIDAVTRRAEDELATALTNGWDVDTQELNRWTSVLGVDPNAAHVCAILTMADSADPLAGQRLRRQVSSALTTARLGPSIFGEADGSLIVFVPLPDGPSSLGALDTVLTTLLRHTADCLAVSVGESTSSLRTVHRSFTQASAVRNASNPDLTSRTLVHYADVLLDILINSDVEAREKFEIDRVGPIRDAAHLMDTITALAESNMSQSATAKRLYVHVNTVSARSKRIQELTGRNPLVFNDLVELYLASRVVVRTRIS